MATRCCWPPDSSVGAWRQTVAEGDRGQRLGGPLAPLLGLHTERYERRLDVLLRGQRRDEVERLEDDADLLGAQPGQLGLADGGEVHAVQLDAAGGGAVETADHLQQGGLAAARGALDDELVAVLDGEVDATQRLHRLLAPRVALGDASELVHEFSEDEAGR